MSNVSVNLKHTLLACDFHLFLSSGWGILLALKNTLRVVSFIKYLYIIINLFTGLCSYFASRIL